MDSKRTYLQAATVAVLLVGTLLLSACSVKEDRSPCPSWLNVISDGDVPESFRSMTSGITWNIWKAPSPGEETLVVGGENREHGAFMGTDNQFAVPREVDLIVSGVSGIRVMEIQDSLLLIPRGAECDSVFSVNGEAYFSEGDEAVTIRRPVRKQFATAFLSITGAEEDYPYAYTVISDVDGYDLLTMTPHKGLFSFTPSWRIYARYAVFRVPRQVNYNMALSIKNIYTGEIITVLSIGEMIRNLSYDWTTDNLEDIYIGLDWAHGSISIKVGPWEIVDMFTISY